MAKLLDEQAKLPPQRFLARLVGTSPLGPESESWYKGALGEIEVGKVLAGLGPGWEVLHAIPVGKGTSDIDHVVIGPPGVFTLNTKNHSGQRVWVGGNRFMIGGARHPHVPNAVYEARRAARLLGSSAGREVHVAALLVLVEPVDLTVKKRPDGVAILKAGDLQRWFSRQPRLLGPADVEHLAAAARAPGTWHENPSKGQDHAAVAAEFTALHRSVRGARLRQGLWWIGGGLVAVGGGGFWVVSQFAGSALGGIFGG
jgi:hypothetical protein